jgi:hypothetical protein
MSNPLLDYIEINKEDAVLYKATALIEKAGDDEFEKSLTLDPICAMLSGISREMLLEKYTKSISKLLGIKPIVITNLLKKDSDKKKQQESVQVLGEGQKALPRWINKEYYYRYGFDQRTDLENKENTGIYFSKGNNESVQLTNFTMKPLIHVFSSDDNNRRLTEINNGYVREVIELPSDAWASPDKFERILMDKGVYFTYDGFTRSHLNKLKGVFIQSFPRCYELKNLGWQKEGFFAFSNLIYSDGIEKFDEYGVAEVNDIKYLSMGASKALAGLRGEDDDYKNDKYLKYVHTGLTFTAWTQLMMDAYLERGMMGICFAIMACYKDIIFKRNNNCPIPYLFGAAQSGKSKMGESIAALSTLDMPALNLNQTTEFALWERLGRFSNIPILFNEFDEKSIKEEYTRAFKGAYDGEGRAKGSGRKGKTSTQPINCLPVLMGQYLSTGDDGALLQRTIPIKFVEDNNRSDEQVKRFRELKDLEKEGITSISCELFRHRDYVSDNFNRRYYETLEKMTAALAADNLNPKTRILENFVNALTITTVVAEKIELAFSIDDFFEYCKEQIKTLSVIISETNALADFWKTIESMVDESDIEQGYHFKVETKSEILLAGTGKDRNTTYKKTFAEPKKLLYLRFNSIHTMYMKHFRSATGKTGIGAATVQIYMQDQESFIGSNPASSFRSANGTSTNTSSYIFDYDLLNVNLERMNEEEDERRQVTLEGVLQDQAELIDFLGNIKMTFTLFQDESYNQGAARIKKYTYTKCETKDIAPLPMMIKGRKVKLSGLLEEKQIPSGVKRKLEVHSLTILNNGDETGDLPF